MKRPHLLMAGVMCYALFFEAQAQSLPPVHKLLPEKASLFSKLPEQFNVTNLWIDNLFTGPGNGAVTIPLTTDRFFEGTITERVRMNAHVVNVNVKSSNYDGALLSVSKVTNNDLTVKYIGIIVSLHYGDVFILSQENNTLSFKKKKQSVVIAE